MLFYLLFSIKPAYGQNLSFGQESNAKKYLIEPGIAVGYSLNGDLNFSFNLDAGIQSKKKLTSYKGLSYNFKVLRIYKKFQTQNSFQVFHQNNFIDYKLGLGRIKKSQGYGRRYCLIFGLATDISIKHPNLAGPKLGINNFIENTSVWTVFPSEYQSAYLGYDFQAYPLKNN